MNSLRSIIAVRFLCLALFSGCSAHSVSRIEEPLIGSSPKRGQMNHAEQAQVEGVSGEIAEVHANPNEISTASFEDVNVSRDLLDLPPQPPGVLAEELPLPAAMPQGELQLIDVVASVERSYPLIHATLAEMEIADGKLTSAWGEFDLNVLMFSISEPLGYYQNYRNGLALKQDLWKGGYVYSEYRIGDGDFAPWYGEQQTDEGGEFKVGFRAPLLKNRQIDARRAAIMQNDLARAAVDPAVRAQVLQFVRVASQAYWAWVAAGRAFAAQQELLDLARDRARQVEERVKAGDLEEIALINNQQMIASREAKLIEAERKLQSAAIKLSLFFRSPVGEPIVPMFDTIPRAFPEHTPPPREQLSDDINVALQARPEFKEIHLLREQVAVDLASANNSFLPKVDYAVIATQDVGGKASPSGDKAPFQLEAAIYGEVPVQRREAFGKLRAAEGKLAQLTAKQQFVSDKVKSEVQDAYSGMITAADRITRAKQNVKLAERTRELGKLAFDEGDADIISLNIYEQAVNDAELQLIDAQAAYFDALADYHASLGDDPQRVRQPVVP